ncbi:MAG: hypothetical protein ACRD01_13325 [Terriglobales bacterium]
MRLTAVSVALIAFSAGALAQSAAPAAKPGTEVRVELETKLDSHKSKVGQQVKAKLNQDLKSSGQVILAKNSMLLGVVTMVTASDSGGPAKLGVLFNQGVPKQGAAIALRAAIIHVIPDENSDSNAGVSLPTEMGGGSVARTMDAGNPAYAHMDRSTNGMPIQYSLMETYNGSGTDLGGVIQSVGNNFTLDDGTHIEVRILH